jgi:hypothetical protein
MTPNSINEACCFKQSSLQQTFYLLRQGHPSLALAVQNIIAHSKLSLLPEQHDEAIEMSLEAEMVSDIICSLSDIGDQACHSDNQSEQQLITLRTVLLEWLVYAQQFLADEAVE